jgi:cytochrome c oxidase subunit 2
MLLAITIWIITLISVILFAGRFWWFPESASAHGALMDTQFVYTLIVTGLIFILAQVSLGYFIIRYRERPGHKATYSHGNDKMEIIWTTATTVLFYVMVLLGFQVWIDMYIQAAPEDALQIEVTGQQFAWNIRYSGPDGQFGSTSPELIDDSAGNPLGLDPDDPAGEDDIVVPTMAVPVDRPIELLLRSKDVTHSFSVRELRVKQDTLPGMVIPLRFVATKLGHYEIACAELCGLGHHRMRSFLDVFSEGDYDEWLREQSEF